MRVAANTGFLGSPGYSWESLSSLTKPGAGPGSSAGLGDLGRHVAARARASFRATLSTLWVSAECAGAHSPAAGVGATAPPAGHAPELQTQRRRPAPSRPPALGSRCATPLSDGRCVHYVCLGVENGPVEPRAVTSSARTRRRGERGGPPRTAFPFPALCFGPGFSLPGHTSSTVRMPIICISGEVTFSPAVSNDFRDDVTLSEFLFRIYTGQFKMKGRKS